MEGKSEAERWRIKLEYLADIEGYERVGELLEGRGARQRVPGDLHERGLREHGRDGAGSGPRLLRGLRDEFDGLGARARGDYLSQ